MMEGVLVKIMLLLLLGTCSSSQDPAVNIVEKNNEKYFTTIGPVYDASRDDATSNKKVSGEIEMSTAELPTFRASTEESGVTPEQEMRSAGGTSVEEASTSSSSEPSPTFFRLRPVIDLVSPPTDLSVTSHEGNKTDGHETTPSHPNYETVGTSKPVDSKKPSNPMSPPPKGKQDDKGAKTVILIAVCMVILVLILIAVIVVLVRNKRRSGSQSFHTQSRSSKRENVWAGQVPDLGDGKMTERPVGTENGAAGNKPEKEQEMITFISEKKNDSVEALNEMNNGAAQEEQNPLLEDGPQDKDETAAALNV
ncbi:uncharacterized protein LOC143785203 [Ranitomeya variabilis]|uniref:uncharacterized protein LOC143785203 n=1 Tax=Ranitomeya variabilis TaxID=490064 RepID=UPI0040574E19